MQNSSLDPNLKKIYIRCDPTKVRTYLGGWLGKLAFDEFVKYFIYVLKSKNFFSYFSSHK